MSSLYADDKAAQLGIAVSLSLLVVMNVIGNTLVILIILRNNCMKSPMNYLLVNLAVADIMVGVFLMPRFVFIHFFTHPDGLAGKLLCNTLTGANISWVGVVASSSSLVAVCFERYFAVVHHSSTKYRLTYKKVKWIGSGCWIWALIFNIPVFFIREFEKEKNTCEEKWPENKPILSVLYSLAWFFIVGAFPMLIMLVLYSKVIFTLWFKRKKGQGTQLAVLRLRKRVTKIAVIVSVVYAASMFPTLIMYVNEGQDHDVSYTLSLILLAFNSTINPFVYGLQSHAFRRHLIKIVFYAKLHPNRVGITESANNNNVEHDIAKYGISRAHDQIK